MTNILEKIVQQKRKEVEQCKKRVPVTRLEEGEMFIRSCYNLADFVRDPDKSGIIAEYKRASPSKGIINAAADPGPVAQAYMEAKASAVSVLSDSEFFKGSTSDVRAARKAIQLPLLRKEFIIDPYQIVEAKAIGADIILLIAAILSPEEVKQFAGLARSLQLNVLLEVHNREELERSLCPELDAVGVNNRNLKDFNVSLDHSYDLVERIPGEFLKVSESGISDPQTIVDLKKAGFDAFLIGENFMRSAHPGKAMDAFVQELKWLEGTIPRPGVSE